MRVDTLPGPGIGPRGHLLRTTAAQAISQVQIAAAYYPSGKHPDAVALSAFFEECRAACAALVTGSGTPVPTPTPGVSPLVAWSGSAVAFGDSVAAGTGATVAGNSWIKRLAANLGLAFTNMAVSGWGLEDEYTQSNKVTNAYITANGTGANKKTNAILVIGGNDVFTSDTNANISPTKFASALRQRLAVLRLAGYAPESILLGSLYPVPDVGLASQGVNRTTWETWNATIAPVASEYGVCFANLYSIGGGVPNASETVADNIHPNDAGHQRLADTAPSVTTILNSRARPTGLAANSPAAAQLAVSFAAAAGNPTGYTAEYATAGTFLFGNAKTVAATTASFTGLAAGDYQVRVRAEFADGSGPWEFLSAVVPVAASSGGAVLKLATGGSSTWERSFSDYTGYTDNPRVTVSTDGSNFVQLGGTGAGGHTLGDLLVTGLDRDVKFLKAGVRATTLQAWEANGSTQRAALVSGINAMGGVDMLLFQCGYNDATSSSTITVASHAAMLRSFIAKVRSETGLPNLKVLLGGSQRNLAGNTTTEGKQGGIVRRAEMLVAEDANVSLGCQTYDIPLAADNIHQTEAGYVTMSAPRWAQTIISMVQGGSAKRGPRITATAPVSNTQTDVTLAHGAGSDFTPTAAITGFIVSKDGGTTFTNATGARVNATTVRLTHADSGGVAQVLEYATQGAPDIAGVLLDNTAPKALPLEVTPNSVAIAATGNTGTPPPTGGTTDFTDDFTGTDGASLASRSGWTVPAGAFTIQSNAAYCSTAPGNALSTASLSSADGYAEATLAVRSVLANSHAVFVLIRAVDSSNFYQAGYRGSTGSLSLGKTVAGTFAELATVAYTPVAGASPVIRIEASGSTLRLLVDGVEKLTATDTALTAAGKVGFRTSGVAAGATTGFHIDNIKAGALG